MQEPDAHKGGQIVVDGTNVLFWEDETPKLETLRKVVRALEARKFEPVVFLDASTRHHLKDRTLGEAKFARVLELPVNRVMVVPKGSEADAFLLKYAKKQRIPVLSNDKFRDRAREKHGLSLHGGSVVKGRVRLRGL